MSNKTINFSAKFAARLLFAFKYFLSTQITVGALSAMCMTMYNSNPTPSWKNRAKIVSNTFTDGKFFWRFFFVIWRPNVEFLSPKRIRVEDMRQGSQ